MPNKSMRLPSYLAAFLIAIAPALAADLQIRGIVPIPLRDGVNTVPDFAPDGRPATIVQAWRENGNAHSYNVFLVILPRLGGEGSGLVGIDDGTPSLVDTITDAPYDGERVQRSVRFARARIDGVPTIILIRADLKSGPGQTIASPKPVEIRVYRLDRSDSSPGTTPDVFSLVHTQTTASYFCNADKAVEQTLGLPLPSHYQGGTRTDGC